MLLLLLLFKLKLMSMHQLLLLMKRIPSQHGEVMMLMHVLKVEGITAIKTRTTSLMQTITSASNNTSLVRGWIWRCNTKKCENYKMKT